jgi:hypothetical protein
MEPFQAENAQNLHNTDWAMPKCTKWLSGSAANSLGIYFFSPFLASIIARTLFSRSMTDW